MLTLFKGELTLNDILHGLPKKRLIELRDSKLRALKEEHDEMDKLREKESREQARRAILAP